MGTIMIYILIKGRFDFNRPQGINTFGKIITNILAVFGIIIWFITAGLMALFENLFIVPVWCLYNLCHKKEYRKSYVNFLSLKDLD